MFRGRIGIKNNSYRLAYLVSQMNFRKSQDVRLKLEPRFSLRGLSAEKSYYVQIQKHLI